MWHNTFPASQAGSNIFVNFYEPLRTEAPASARPFCWGFGSVNFYRDEASLEIIDSVRTAWDLLGTRWTDEDIGFAAVAPFVEHEGVYYELIGGRVVWIENPVSKKPGWFMEWTARRVVAETDNRLMAWKEAVR